MRTTLTLALGLFAATLFAQTSIQKKYQIQKGQELTLKFDYPQLVKITTWDKNEIEISGKVDINNNQNNGDFVISEQTLAGNTKLIEGKVTNYKDLPQHVVAYKGDDKITFKSKKEFQEYEKANKTKFDITSIGVQIDIVLEIKVPRNTKTLIESTYGTVEVNTFDGPLVAKSTYGSVDATIDQKKVGELNAECFYGKIFTNLDLPVKPTKSEDFHTAITAYNGKEPRQEFSSKYGNVYLRK